MTNTDGLNWRERLRRRDTIARRDELHARVDQLDFRGREALRLWFCQREREDQMDDEAEDALRKAQDELRGLLMWLSPMELAQVVKIVRAIAAR